MKISRIAVVMGLCLMLGILSACGSKKNHTAMCVDRDNQVVDPSFCQRLQADAITHRSDPGWIGAFVPYQWAYGGRLNGLTYVGGQSRPLYEPLPKSYRQASSQDYTRISQKAKPTTSSTGKAKASSSSTSKKKTITTSKKRG